MKLTLALIAINVAVFFLSLSNPAYFIGFAFSVESFLAGNYYNVVTAMFLHASLMHLAGNMIALFLLGWALEKEIKAWQYLLAYFAGGIFGNLSLFIPLFGYSPQTIALGASAAISGLVGIGIFMCPGKLVVFPSIIPLPFALAGAIYLLSTMSNIFMPSEVAYSAHLLGFSAGAMLGLIWGENRKKRLLIFITLLAMFLFLPPLIIFLLG